MGILTVEEAIRSLIVGMSAVQALGVGDAIRVGAFEAGDGVPDTAPGILITPESESYANDLSGRGGLRSYVCKIGCAAGTFLAARKLLEAVRENGTTPGTGLAGFSGTVTVGSNSLTIGMITLDQGRFEHGFLEDGSDEKWFAAEADATVEYQEPV